MTSTDEWLGAELRAEVPPRPPDYWTTLDARLADAAAESGPVDVSTNSGPRHGSREAAVTDLADERPGRRRLRRPTVLIAAAAAAVLLVLALAVPALRDTTDGQVDTGFVSQPDRVELEALPGPAQNVDHWNAIYGVWDCTANGGAGEWLPPFQSHDDDVGIHSHGDGLISIHPFFERSAGRNATFSHFVDSMNISVTTDAITLDDGRMLESGAQCGDEPAVVHLRRWQSAPALEADPDIEPYVVTDDFGDERFYNDLEVWVIALAPLDADIGLPPLERFNELANWWFPPPGLLPDDLEFTADPNIVLPEGDQFVSLRRAAQGSDADASLEALRAASRELPLPELPFAEFPLVSGSGAQFVAVAPGARSVVTIAEFVVLDEAPGLAPTLTCRVTTKSNSTTEFARGGCSRSDSAELDFTRTVKDTSIEHQSVQLWTAPADASFLIVHTSDGTRIVAEVLDGTGFAIWPIEHGPAASISVVNADGRVVWGDPL